MRWWCLWFSGKMWICHLGMGCIWGVSLDFHRNDFYYNNSDVGCDGDGFEMFGLSVLVF